MSEPEDPILKENNLIEKLTKLITLKEKESYNNLDSELAGMMEFDRLTYIGLIETQISKARARLTKLNNAQLEMTIGKNARGTKKGKRKRSRNEALRKRKRSRNEALRKRKRSRRK